MSALWMPGVERRDTGRRLTMRGDHGARIFTHHTFETNYSITRDRAFEVLNTNKSDPHFVFNPVAGWIFQMLPANTGARTLRASGASTNTWGQIHMQVEVIGWAAKPWTNDLTDAGRETLARLMDFLRSWGIPDRWCHGIRPPVYPGPGVTKRQPTMSGHFHHAGWVVNNHGDPGRIADPWAIAPPKPAPAPAEPAKPEWETPQHIRSVQQLLNDVTDAGLTDDGVRGPATEAATEHYQANVAPDFGHTLDADGSPGPLTRSALEADMSVIKELTAKVDAIPAAVWSQLMDAPGSRDPDKQKYAATYLRYGATSAQVNNVADGVTKLDAQVAGLNAAVKALAEAKGFDPEQITTAIRDAVTEATADMRIILTTAAPEEN